MPINTNARSSTSDRLNGFEILAVKCSFCKLGIDIFGGQKLWIIMDHTEILKSNGFPAAGDFKKDTKISIVRTQLYRSLDLKENDATCCVSINLYLTCL